MRREENAWTWRLLRVWLQQVMVIRNMLAMGSHMEFRQIGYVSIDNNYRGTLVR